MKKILLILIFTFSFSVHAKPTHLVFMVFDQMRPDYIDRFDLKNFKRVRSRGANYQDGYVGHMASVTVVSHAVMTTGLLPKDLPWVDNVMWDKDEKLEKPAKMHKATDLTQEQYLKLLAEIPADQFLVKRFKDQTSRKVFAIAEKDYAAIAMGGPYGDAIIYAEKKDKNCIPFGVNVPERILKQDRFTIDCSSTYGTEKSLYPLDGHRFYPGEDKDHLGGDPWVADLALDIMRNEKDWGALFLSFGAIDRFGHMLGETDGETHHAFSTPLHLKDVAKIADEQLGRILQELEKQKILDQTMIVITADHGGQTNEIFLGNPPKPSETFWIQRLKQAAPLKSSSMDTGVRLWLENPTEKNIKNVVEVLKEINQVTEVYALDRKSKPVKFKLEFERLKTQSKKFQKWAKEHNAEIVDSFATEAGPDIVANLTDTAGFGKLGDHGGLQENVQRIPMLVSGPGFKANSKKGKLRLVDLEPLISKSFELKPAK